MKSSKSTINKRHEAILSSLQEKGEISTNDLCHILGVSISTIRRDLTILEEKNEIIRKHGAVSLNRHNHHFDETGPELLKSRIARQAASFINDYSTIFINTSSTALMTLKFVNKTNLNIISNNLKLVNFKKDNSNNYLLTGGEMRLPKEALVGDIAIQTILDINADICVIGCSGVDLENGVTTQSVHEAKVNEAMIRKTIQKKILVADYRKIGLTSKFKIADISTFDYLITDHFCEPNIIKLIEEQGVIVVQV